MLDGFQRIHRFLAHHLLYPIALSSLLAVAFFVGRVLLSESLTHFFLMWNLFLAWLPYLCSLWMAYSDQRGWNRWWQLSIPFILWLIFFPNTIYLVTDLANLDKLPPIPLWYDVGLFITCAWTGCLLAVVSLNTVQQIVRNFFGRAASWLFVFSTVGLTGLGIYLGRFLRYNSWDLFFHPGDVLEDAASGLIHPLSHLAVYGVIFMFGAFLLVCYLTFIAIQQRSNA